MCCQVDSEHSDSSYCAVCAHEEEKASHVSMRMRYLVGGISAIFLSIGILFELSSVDAWIFLIPYLVAALTAGRWIIPRGIRGLSKLHLDVNFLMTAAATGAFIIGAPAEGASVLFLFFIADLLEKRTETEVKNEIAGLLELEPQTAVVRRNGDEVYVHVEEVKKDEVIILKPGQIVSLDGIVIEGSSTVNQAAITGESVPVYKEIGDNVFAGTFNVDGYLEVRVSKESDETVLSKIIELVSETQKRKSPTEKFVSRFSHIYTPIVVVTALSVVIALLIIGMNTTDAIYRGLALLVVSCPCAFAISIPVSMVSALGSSARDGVLVKGSEFIEFLSEIDAISFDKTGTLTQGKLVVDGVCLHDQKDERELLAIAAQLESMSEHPIAQAIVDAANQYDIDIDEATGFTSLAGKGIKGEISGITYTIGNAALLRDLDVELSQEHKCGSGTLVYVLQDKSHLGTIKLNDTLRETSKVTLAKLRDMNIETIMLTGDDKVVAEEIANSLGIRYYKSNLLPHEKVAELHELSKQYEIAMVGDGINDAPSLAAADVGIAMGGIASDVAIDTADVVLMNENIGKLPALITRARKTMSVIKTNVAFSLSVKLFIAALAILGMISLWMALVAGDVGLTIVVVMNALRITRGGDTTGMISEQSETVQEIA